MVADEKNQSKTLMLLVEYHGHRPFHFINFYWTYGCRRENLKWNFCIAPCLFSPPPSGIKHQMIL